MTQLRLLATAVLLLGVLGCTPWRGLENAPSDEADLRGIRETLQLYAIYLDDARAEEFLDLFTEEAVFTAASFEYRGRDSIRRELAEKPRRAGKHLPFPAVIEFVSATEALAWSDFLRVKIEVEGDPTRWQITSIGRYYDRLVRGEDGRWRIDRRDVHLPAMENRVELVGPDHRRDGSRRRE